MTLGARWCPPASALSRVGMCRPRKPWSRWRRQDDAVSMFRSLELILTRVRTRERGVMILTHRAQAERVPSGLWFVR